MTCCEKLNRFISENGLKLRYVAAKAGLDPELLGRSLVGKRKLPADEFVSLCRALSLGLDYFKD